MAGSDGLVNLFRAIALWIFNLCSKFRFLSTDLSMITTQDSYMIKEHINMVFLFVVGPLRHLSFSLPWLFIISTITEEKDDRLKTTLVL